MATIEVVNPYEHAALDDKSKWTVVYPAYINAKKKKVEGRRVSLIKAIDVPQCTEIRDICISQGLNAEIESKQYPREHARDNMHSGRIRVQIKKSDGTPINAEIKTKKELLDVLCQLLPKLKTRQSRSSDHISSSANTSKKKKGKKK